MFHLVSSTPPTLAETAQPANSNSLALGIAEGFAIFGLFTVTTPGAKVFASTTDINAGTDTFTKTAHGMQTGLKGQFTTSSALPTGLSTSTDYFVIVVDANNVKFATSLANAILGTAIDITTTGTGNQTFTPTALAGASAKLQMSNDGTNWADIPSTSQNITATGTIGWNNDKTYFKNVRVAVTLTAGQLTSVFTFASKQSM